MARNPRPTSREPQADSPSLRQQKPRSKPQRRSPGSRSGVRSYLGSLFGGSRRRPGSARSAAPRSWAGGEPLSVEPLESRHLLTVATAWVNDNWTIDVDTGPAGLSAGDTVSTTDSDGGGPVTGKTFGTDAFSTIPSGLAGLDPGGTLHVLNGSYSGATAINKGVDLLGHDTVSINGGLASAAINVTSATPVAIDNIQLTGGLTGISVNGSTLDLTNSTVAGAAVFGIQVSGAASDVTIDHSEVSTAATGAAAVNVSAGNADISNSILTGSQRGLLVSGTGTASVAGSSLVGNSIRAVENASVNPTVVDASGNWWGSTDEAVVQAATLGDVDFTPYLASGADGNGAAVGFEGDFSAVYVTSLGFQTGLDGRVQEGIDDVDAGGTVNVNSGTYTGLISVGKDVDVVGVLGTTTLQAGVATASLVEINGSGFGDDETVRFQNIDFDGQAGLADRGIRVQSTADFAKLEVSDGSFSGFDFAGVIVFGNSTTGLSVQDVELTNLTFAGNGTAGGGGSADVQLFTYNGDATLTNLDLVGSGSGGAGIQSGIQLRGTGDAVGTGDQPIGTVVLNDIDISGHYVRQFIGLQRYSDLAGLTMTDVKLGGVGSEITGSFGSGLRIDAVGDGTTSSPSTFNLGNTHFRGLDGTSAQRHEIEFAPDNSHTFLRVDATGTTWNIGGTDFAAGALSVSQGFDVEDRILHYVDKLHPAHGVTYGGYKGFVDVQALQAFVTDAPDAGVVGEGSVNRAVEIVGSGGTVHIASGTYDQEIDTSGNNVTLAPGSSPGQVILGGNLTLDGDDTLAIEIDGTNAASDYDNFVVTGAVTLGGAALSATRGFDPTFGDTFTLVDNDDTDAVTGTFAGYAEGSTVTIDSIPFTISYVGGTGNDVTLTVTNPSEVWVNDNWVISNDIGPGGLSYGDTVENTGAGDNGTVTGKIFGYNAFDVIQDALDALTAAGTAHVLAGLYAEGPQIVVDQDVTIVGEGKALVTINPTADTGTSGDARGWFLVETGINLDLSGVTLDGDGYKIWQAIRHKGTGTIDEVAFSDIQFNASGPHYNGVAIAAFGGVGPVDVTNSMFSDIGRIGVLYFGPGTTGTFEGNTYTGKGAGDWLDYALDVSNGAQIDILSNTISGNLGVASSDSSTSAGILVSTFFGPGTQATISNNVITGNTTGVAVGFDSADTSDAVIFDNDLSGNTFGVSNSSATTTVDASGNWWGTNAAAGVAGLVTAGVDYTPWLDVGTDTSAAPGFQGDFSYLHVDDDSPQSGSTGRIQEGIDLLADGLLTGASRVVDVKAGTYIEQVEIDKEAMLLGAQVGVDARLRSAVPETIVMPDVSDPDPNTAPNPVLFYITSDNVTVDGFTFDGDNPALTSGVILNGADLDAEEAIASYEGVGGLTVQNNIVQNTSYSGFDFYNYNNSGGATSDNVITQNWIKNLGAFGWGIGILVYNNFYAEITDNLIEDVRVGVQTGNFYQANPGAAATISNNEINARRLGVFYNLHYSNASPWTLDSNAISAADDASVPNWFGMLISSQQTAVDATITNNTIDGSGVNAATTATGYTVWNTPTTADLTITGGTVSGVNYGVWVNNYEGYNSNASDTSIKIDGVDITATDIGVYVLDSPSNTNGSSVFATITGDTEITTGGTGTGIKVEGADASADILDNDASIHGNLIGIDVDGSAATISGNSIYDNGTGVLVQNGGAASILGNDFSAAANGVGVDVDGGTALIEDNDLTGNGVGIRVQNNGLVDAGDTDGANVTGLGTGTGTAGSSAGNNVLTGYTGIAGNFAIEDLNLDPEFDVQAQNNLFGSIVASVIEQVVYHTVDNAANTLVEFTPAQGTAIPGVVYVNDDWAGTALASDPDGGYANGNSFGTDAFATIQDAINAVSAGATIYVLNGTYDETIVIDKGLTLEHLDTVSEPIDPNSAVDATITSTSGTNDKVLVEVQADDVTMIDFHLIVDRAFAAGGIVASNSAIPSVNVAGGSFANLTLLDNIVESVGDNIGAFVLPGGLPASAMGIVLHGQGGPVHSVLLQGNQVLATIGTAPITGPNPLGISIFTRGLYLGQVQATVGGAGVGEGNTLQGLAQDLLVQFASGGTTDIIGNTFNAAGVDVSGSNAASPVNIADNLFDMQSELVPQSLLIRAINDASSTVTVSGNTFTGHTTGVVVDASSAVVIDDNEFTASNAAVDYAHIVLDTNRFDSTSVGPLQPVGATITNNMFHGSTGNGTALVLADSNTALASASPDFAGIVLGGAGNENTFDLGVTTFIKLDPAGAGGAVADDLDASDNFFEVSGGTKLPSAMTLSEQFELEDKIVHAIDVAALGFVTVVAGQVFVTTNSFLAPHTTAASVQRGIDAAAAGDTVNVNSGTYTGLISVGKDVDVVGVLGTTTLQAGVATASLVEINGSGFGDDETVRFQNIDFDGQAGLADRGIRVQSTADFAKLEVSDGSFSGFDFAGVIVFGNSTTGLSVQDVELTNLTFAGNGTAGGGGSADVQLFTYNGDATLTNLDLVGSGSGGAGIQSGIQLRGTGDAVGTGDQPIGTVVLNDIDISGHYVRQFIGLQRYSDLAGLTMTDVKLGGVGSEITGSFGSGLRIDAVGDGTTSSPSTFNLGNTHFRGLDGTSAQRHEIEFAPDNSHTFLRVDATGTTWNIGGTDFAAGALSVSQGFDVEDRILHYVDKLHPAHGVTYGGYKGFVDVQALQAFVTDAPDAGVVGEGSVNRAVEIVGSGGTVHIASGTYDQEIDTSGNNVTLAPGSSPGQVILGGNLTLDGDDTLAIEIDGTNAASDYDNFVVTGAVTLGGAALSATRGFDPTFGDTFTLVDNDDTDAVTGTFAGYAEGSTVTIDSIPFTISYVGGTGNDVTLTVTNPSEVWVNDNWVISNDIGPGGLSYGDTVENTGAGDNGTVTGKIFGYNAFDVIQDALDALTAAGTAHVLAGLYAEGPQIVVDQDVTIVGEGKALVTINPTADTGTSGDARGWFLVETGINLDLSGVTLDGDGYKIWQAIRHKGTGTIDEVAFSDIQFNASGPHYNGVAIAAFGGVGPVDVTNSMFSDIGRIGVLYFGPGTTGTFEGNTYTGKGAGDWLDYALDVSNGAQIDILSNTISGNLGVASSDSSTSAGILVSTFFGPGTQATISNNVITGNTTGVAVGFDSADTSDAVIFDNDLSGNTFGVSNSSATTTVDASGNWWGTNAAAGVAGLVTAGVDYTPWLDVGTDTSAAPGFQGDFSYLHVDDDSPQSGSTGRIQEGIDLLADGLLTGASRVVDVKAGTYIEQVEIDKEAMLLGAQVGVDARLRSAVPETIVMPDVSDPDPNTAPNPVLFYITSDNVTVDGFTFDGDNPALTSGVILNGADLDAEEAIASYEGVGGLTVQNNIVQNTSYSGFDFYNYNNSGGATSDNVITQNWIKNLGAFGWGIGILVYNNFYAEITDNLIEDVRVGVQTGNFYQANPGAAATISNNEINARRLGVFYNLHYSNASPWTLDSNAISAADDASVPNWFGMLISSQQTAVDATITNNTIDGSGVNAATTATGYTVWNTPTTADLTITGGTVSGVNYGVWVNNYEGYNSNASDTSIKIDGVDITATDIGVYVLDSPSNTNGSSVFATITGDTEITTGGTGTGIKVEGADASADILDNDASIHGNLIGIDVDTGSATINNNHIYDNGTGVRFINGGSGSLADNNFVGPADNDTDLFLDATAGTVTIGANNAFAGDTFFIDNQSTQSYDLSANGTTFDETNDFRIEDKMHHRVDTDLPLSNGLITWVADTLFVTDGGTDHSIQRGVDAASAGNTLYVEEGTYNYAAGVMVDKALVIRGAQWGVDARTRSAVPETILEYTGPGPAGAFDIKSDNVTIDGFLFDNASYAVTTTGGTTGRNNIKLLNNLVEGGAASAYGFFTLRIGNGAGNEMAFNYLKNINTVADSSAIHLGLGSPAGTPITARVHIHDNKIEDALVGINAWLEDSTIEDNEILGNPSLIGGGGITGQFANTTIDSNAISGYEAGAALAFVAYLDRPTSSGLTITNNMLLGNLAGMAVGHNGAGLLTLFQDNTITNVAGGASISHSGPDTLDLTITTNPTFTGNTLNGVSLHSPSLADQFAIEDSILHLVDGTTPTPLVIGLFPTVGRVLVVQDNLYVTPNSFNPTFLGTTTPSIQRAVDAADAGFTVNVQDGTYTESNITIDKALTLLGQSQAATIVPDGVDSHVDDSFAGSPLQAIIVMADDVTVSTLTIDGGANNDFRSGVITPNDAIDRSNLVFTDLAVKNIYRRAIQITWSGSNNEISNNVITQNTGPLSSAGAGIAVFGGNASPALATRVEDNTVNNTAAEGIVSNFGALLTITGNDISNTPLGMNLAALDAGSIIGGPALADQNTVDLTGLGSDDIGILVTFSGDSPFTPGTVTIQGNEILAADGDSGIWIFRTGVDPVLILDNTITGTTSSSSGAGSGAGIFITDDDELLGESSTDNDANVEIRGNTIDGMFYGVHVRSVDDEGAAETLAVTIGGASLGDENDISGAAAVGSKGIFVEDDANPSSSVVSILNNDSSIHGFAVGVDVDGGTATISGNHIYDNTTGIRVSNSGTATITGNDFDGAADPDNATDVDVDGATAMLESNVFHATTIGLLVQGGAIVDAGQTGRPAPADFTGLGISSGGNDFTDWGTTAATSSSGAIVNLNTNSPNDLGGPQGDPNDTTAFGNVFDASLTSPGAIAGVIWDDADDATVGFVDFAALASLTITDFSATTIDEGDMVTMIGSFTNDPQDHTLTIDWGDGNIEVIHLLPGTFNFSVPHTYADDDPTATPSDVYPISVTVQEGFPAAGASLNDTTSITVDNVAPTIAITGAPGSSPEGTLINLGSSVSDPGTLDTFTYLWEVSSTNGQVIPNGASPSFSFTPDDNGTYTVTLTVTDDDGGVDTDTAIITVTNVAPSIDTISITSPINENDVATLSGTYSDAGSADTHTIDIDWDGDLVYDELGVVVTGGVFSINHTYLDDDPTGTISDTFNVNVRLNDDDSDIDTDSASITVDNVAPTIAITGAPGSSPEGTLINLGSSVSDPGTLDTFTYLWEVSSTNGQVIPDGAASTFSFTPNDNGTYTVTLTVTDDDGGVDTDTAIITVTNVAPSIDTISITSPINENDVATLSGTYSDAGSADTHTIDIDWDGDLVYDELGVVVTGGVFSINHTYLDDDPTGTISDTFNVNVRLNDDDSDIDTDSASITVDNVAPTVAITGAPGSSPEGTLINLGSSVTDPGTLDTFTYLWEVSSTNGQVIPNGASPSFSFTPDDEGTYTVTLTVTDDDGGVDTDTAIITVTNVSPTIDLSGSDTVVNEGSVFSLVLGPVTDPGDDTIIPVNGYIVFWGDGTSDTYSTNGIKTHTYDDDALVVNPNITVTLVDEDGAHPSAGVWARTVNNVAPTAVPLNGGPVNEGSVGQVLFVGQFDPSNNDTTTGFTYSYDFNNDGDFGDAGELSMTTLSTVNVPATYLDDDPDQTIRMLIHDKDGGFTEYFTTITVNNVAPVVNAGPDATAFAGVPFTRGVTFTDPGNDAMWTVSVDWDGLPGFEDVFNVSAHSFNINHTYGAIDIGNTYTVTVQVDDHDGGIHSDTFDVTVEEDTFRVVNFQTNASGFDVTFNRAPELDDLNLYSGFPSGPIAADVSLMGNTVGDVPGSIVWNAATNTMSFIKTGGVLAPDSYVVTIFSGDNAFADLSNSTPGEGWLDGDGDFDDNEVADHYFQNFVVAPSAARVVSIRDFARGPGQSVDDAPETAGSKLGVRVSNATSVTALDFEVHYNPALLSITAASVAPGLPAGWTTTYNPISPGVIKVTASGFTALSGSDVPVVVLTANVPASAPYGNSEVLRLVDVKLNGGAISSKADHAVHKNAYLGDADGDGIYLAFDSALISRVAVALDTGFDAHNWTDPMIVAEADRNGDIDGQDASYVLQKFVGFPRPEIPNLPGIVLIPGTPGVDPELSVPVGLVGYRNDDLVLPVSIDVLPAESVISSSFDVTYDTAVMSYVGASEGAFWSSGDGWTMLALETSPGVVRVGLANGSSTSPVGAGVIANLEFEVLGSAPYGASPVDIEPVSPNEGGLTWTNVDGSVQIDPNFVVGRQLFYNNSKYDGNTPGVSTSDDGAIATDKTALLPGGGQATFDNISSYSRGINGIILDLAGVSPDLTDEDFIFRVGNNNTPSTWAAAPDPVTVSVRPGAGPGGADRVEIIWADGAIANTWLEVIVKGNDATGGFNTDTGLDASDIFYFGNRIGETGSGTPNLAITNATDEVAARANVGLAASITNLYDFDRSGLVNATDEIIARNNVGLLTKIDITDPPPAPLANPQSASADLSGVALALSLPESTDGEAGGTVWTLPEVGSSELAGSPAKLSGDAASAEDLVAASLLTESGLDAESTGVDEELLASLLAGIELE